MADIGDRLAKGELGGKVVGKEYTSEPCPIYPDKDKIFFTLLTIEYDDGEVETLKIRHTPGG
jgi:hypothetical protein